MNDKERYNQTNKVVAMTKSLLQSIHDAGGYPFGFDFDTMTVTELISVLAPNNILFVWAGSTEEENKKPAPDKILERTYEHKYHPVF